MALMIGGSSTGVTFSENVFESVNTGAPVSVTTKVKFKIPFAFKSGVIVAVQFGATPPNTILPTGTMVASVVVALIEVVQFKTLSGSVIEKFTVSGVSSG